MTNCTIRFLPHGKQLTDARCQANDLYFVAAVSQYQEHDVIPSTLVQVSLCAFGSTGSTSERIIVVRMTS